MKSYSLRLTGVQLEILQRILEEAASDCSEQQMVELEAIDAKIYGALFPALVDPRANVVQREHPMPLRHLRVVHAPD